MIARCRDAGLPETDFDLRSGQFVITLWRDWLTPALVQQLALNERQQKALSLLKLKGRITSREHRDLTHAIPRTATRDLDDMVANGLLAKVGKVGRGAHYVLRRKPDINRTNRTS